MENLRELSLVKREKKIEHSIDPLGSEEITKCITGKRATNSFREINGLVEYRSTKTNFTNYQNSPNPHAFFKINRLGTLLSFILLSIQPTRLFTKRILACCDSNASLYDLAEN